MPTPISALQGIIRVALADAYRDGTVWFSLVDMHERRAHVSIDGREFSPTRNRLFHGAKHPSSPEAMLIELGADEEAVVVPLISRWLDSAPPKTLGLTEPGWEMIREALLRLGEPSM